MRKPIFLFLVALLVPNTLARADGVDDDVANRLAATAVSPCSRREARLAALQALTELGPKASAALGALKTILILPDSVLVNQEELKDLLVYYTAQALATMGEKARSAIPELVEAQGKVCDLKAKKAIATAVVALALAPPDPQPQTSAKKKKTLMDLIDELKSQDNKGDRIAAAKLLGEWPDNQMAVICTISKALLDALQIEKEDPDVRRLIAQSVKQVLKIGSKDQLQGIDNEIKIYVKGLRSMLKSSLNKDNKNPNPNLAIFAAKELGVAAKNLKSVPAEIDLATATTEDPDVISTATNARKLIVQALQSKK